MDQLHSSTFRDNCKRGKHLTFEDRCMISVLHKQGKSLRQIAGELNCSPSTVHYELRRGTLPKKAGSGRPSTYNPKRAQHQYEQNRTTCRRKYKLEGCKAFIRWIIRNFRRNGWSFDTSVGYAKRSGLFKTSEMVSTKTLYEYTWKGLLALKAIELPEAISRRKKRSYSHKNRRINGRSIEERPAYINERIEFGHWEIDTVVGKKKGREPVILTLVEKVTRQFLAFKISGKDSFSVMLEMLKLQMSFGDKFSKIFKSITADNGTEFSALSALEMMGPKIYFAHPYSSSERAQNERHNRILRRFIPKGKSIADYSADTILEYVDMINAMPRKVLGYQSPEELFEEFLDSVYKIG